MQDVDFYGVVIIDEFKISADGRLEFSTLEIADTRVGASHVGTKQLNKMSPENMLTIIDEFKIQTKP